MLKSSVALSEVEPQVNADRGLCQLEQQLLLLPSKVSDPSGGSSSAPHLQGSEGSPELLGVQFQNSADSQKLSTPFCPAGLTCTWNFCTQKGFGFPLALLQEGCGQVFPQIFCAEPNQCLGLGRAAPGPPVLGQAQPLCWESQTSPQSLSQPRGMSRAPG